MSNWDWARPMIRQKEVVSGRSASPMRRDASVLMVVLSLTLHQLRLARGSRAGLDTHGLMWLL